LNDLLVWKCNFPPASPQDLIVQLSLKKFFKQAKINHPILEKMQTVDPDLEKSRASELVTTVWLCNCAGIPWNPLFVFGLAPDKAKLCLRTKVAKTALKHSLSGHLLT
jgi:hypothetical protein